MFVYVKVFIFMTVAVVDRRARLWYNRLADNEKSEYVNKSPGLYTRICRGVGM